MQEGTNILKFSFFRKNYSRDIIRCRGVLSYIFLKNITHEIPKRQYLGSVEVLVYSKYSQRPPKLVLFAIFAKDPGFLTLFVPLHF